MEYYGTPISIRKTSSAVNNLSPEGNTASYRLLKKGIWLYFLLLIFEGALRKWFLPFLATPLLIVRDPLAIWLLYQSLRRSLLPANIYLSATVFIAIVATFTALFLGHGNLPVAIFGARILLIHFPLMFVIGNLFNQEDVIRLGKLCLWLSIPMTFLIAAQFYSPQSAWVNRGIGGDEAGSGFSGALDYFRPSATFSFTTGTTMFYSLCAPFILYFWLNRSAKNNLLLIGASICLLAAIPLSISRSLFFSIAVTAAFTLVAILRKPKYLGSLLVCSIALLLVLNFLSKTDFFETATRAFFTRFETANEEEGGVGGVLGGRYLGALLEPFLQSSGVPFFGYGIGMGTNVGSMLLTGGTNFLISEGEWGRLIGEMGLLLGGSMIFIRLGFCARIAFAAYNKLNKGELLPWLLLSFLLLNVPQAQWAQPTALGFSTLIGGLSIASFRPGQWADQQR